jgi:superfamily II DNA or RNA helicase/HKD family nuclease
MTPPLEPGLYEFLVTADLEARLAVLQDRLVVQRSDLHEAEAANRIALLLGRTIQRAIASLSDNERVATGIQVARDLLARLDELINSEDAGLDSPVQPASVLRAILGRTPDGSPAVVETPLIPLLDTTLLTNSPGEPRVGRQLQAEIDSADQIDALIAFIRYSGVSPLREALRRHCAAGRELRVLTTTYTGSTERKALDTLCDLGADIRVSYDTTTTRLHAKAWLFHRRSGFSTAYVGSSNLTHSAQVSGLEWNVRVSGARNADVIDKVSAVFDSYWERDDYRPYDAAEFDDHARGAVASGPTVFLSPVEIRLAPFQERLLELLAVCRSQGHHRNLLAAATGTGKTVMAAVDYARLRKALPRARLLFVAHREEILDQSHATFRHALRDSDFGEQWVGNHRPRKFDHVFASVQSLRRMNLDDLAPDHFDVVIVDEFHHAAAPSYQRLLDHVQPRELLGLTATPERTDGLPVLRWFEDRIAGELRLWDAIDQHHLTPFLYFGVHDDLDLSQIPWRRGTGYDTKGLSNLYTASDAWARRVIQEVNDHVDDIARMRALGFCVSIEHARFMARVFNDAGIRSVAVWGDSPHDERQTALHDLAEGKVSVVFSVDLFNEGVDVPTVDTLLLLRPTDSPTLFLQQLGRGLRRSEGKTVCTVLDFVGHHRHEFRFDRRLRALLGGTRKDVESQVLGGFPFLPAGCHMELDPVAAEIVLRSIRESIPSRWGQKVQELRALGESGRETRLATYLERTGLDIEDLYFGSRCWSDLCEDAGISVATRGPAEKTLRRAVGRLLHIDDHLRLTEYSAHVRHDIAPVVTDLDEQGRRLLRMLVAPLIDRAVGKTADLQGGVDLLWRHPQVLAELQELFETLRGKTDHVHVPLEGHMSVPLQVHARYTRLEILAGFGVGDEARIAPWQTGVRWLPEAKVDVFAFTLDKTEGTFSPTTRYRDYAISRDLIHWESQSVTRADSPTGLRYQRHAAAGTGVMLFARMRQSDRAFWFLGPAEYVRHVGERPMAVTWRLRYSLPADLFAEFAAVAGA